MKLKSVNKTFYLALVICSIASARVIDNNNESTSTSTNSSQLESINNKNQTVNHLIESLNERLVKQSNLLAEESRQDERFESKIEAPFKYESIGITESPIKRESPGTYWSMSRDGSDRYKFGFDTEASKIVNEEDKSKKEGPRLMREESRLADGTVIGRYGYTDPFNVFRIVQYVAGADGYFAAEDVGGLENTSSDGLRGPNKTLQLNKQLYKALEQAREQRRLRSASVTPSHHLGSDKRQVSPRSDTLEAKESLIDERETDYMDASDSNNSFGFALRINHLTGSDGNSYATAFRPIPQPSEQALRPSSSERDTRRMGIPNNSYREQLKSSRVQAPIFTSTYDASVPVRQSKPEGNSWISNWSPPPINQLEASPAWNILNDNYSKQQILLVDHQGTGAQFQQQSSSIGQQLAANIEANFNREANILKSLQSNKMNQKDQLQFGARSSLRESLTSWSHDSSNDPANNNNNNNQARQNNYENDYSNQHLGLALKHFETPLYKPEVHETRLASQDSNEPTIFTTSIHHYQPQRLSKTINIDSGLRHEENINLQSQPVEDVSTSSDIDTESSEQILVQSSTNGTSRARIPDRSKKILSIFKARQSQANGTRGDSYGTNSGRIRKPKPGSTNKPKSEQETTSTIEPTTTSTTTTYSTLNHESTEKPSELMKEEKNNPNLANLFGQNRPKSGRKSHSSSLSNNDEPSFISSKQKKLKGDNLTVKSSSEGLTPSSVIVDIKQEESATTKTNESEPHEKSASHGQTEPRALVVGMNGLEQHPEISGGSENSTFDKSLYEKILQVQREIMNRKSSNSIDQVSNQLGQSIEPSKIQEIPVISSDVQKSPEKPTLSELTTIDTVKLNQPESSSIITSNDYSNIWSNSTVSTSNGSKVAIVEYPQTQTSKIEHSTTDEKASISDTNTLDGKVSSIGLQLEQANKFSTGTLMNIEASMDQGELLTKLAQDMNAFDSTRSTGQSTETPIVDEKQETTSELAQSSTTSRAFEPTKIHPTTEATKPTTSEPIPNVQTITENVTSTQIPDLLDNSKQTVGNETLPRSIPSTTIPTILPTNSEVTLTSTELLTTPNSPSEIPTITPTSTTSTTSAVVTMPTTTVSLQTNSSNTNQTKPIKAARGGQARIGRLVIKRGDKIVARFNASDPIPDSMIPVHGSASSNGADLILPDLPKLGMRIRNKAKRMGFDLARRPKVSNLTSTSTTEATNQNNTTSSPTLIKESDESVLKVDINRGDIILSTEQPNAQLVEVSSSLNANKTLNRGTRSSDPSEDLMAAESSDIETPLLEEKARDVADFKRKSRQLRADIRLVNVNGRLTNSSGISQRVNKQELEAQLVTKMSGHNWSTRLGSSTGNLQTKSLKDQLDMRPQSLNNNSLKYDAKQELKLLVDKIFELEKQTTNHANREKDQSMRSIDVVKKPKNDIVKEEANHSLEAVIMKKETVPIDGFNVKNQKGNVPNNITTTTISPILNLNTTKDTKLINDNSTIINSIKLNELDKSLALNRSLSSSAKFTLPVTPDLDRQWKQLKPVEPELIKLSEKRLMGAKEGEVRIDSLGHIHVRNNQSLTVHVDIKPAPTQTADKSSTISLKPAESIMQKPSGPAKRDVSMASSKQFEKSKELLDTTRQRPQMVCIEVDQPLVPVSV